MARARRAKRRPARIVVPVLVAVLALGGGAFGVQQGWFDGGSSVSTRSAPSPGAPTSRPASPSVSPSGPSASAEAAGASAEKALAQCRARVEAADRALGAAEVGVGHWAEHVQAQTDANAGTISSEKMDAIFQRTRLAGPDDVEDYEDALEAYSEESGSCDPSDVSAELSGKLERCAERDKAQQPVLEAAEDAMQDWESHLAAMRRSRTGHVHDAQGVWIRAWRAAPPHLEAYADATREFDAPRC